LEAQDSAEIDRIKANVERSRKALQTLGYAELTFEDFFTVTYQLRSSFLVFLGLIFFLIKYLKNLPAKMNVPTNLMKNSPNIGILCLSIHSNLCRPSG